MSLIACDADVSWLLKDKADLEAAWHAIWTARFVFARLSKKYDEGNRGVGLAGNLEDVEAAISDLEGSYNAAMTEIKEAFEAYERKVA